MLKVAGTSAVTGLLLAGFIAVTVGQSSSAAPDKFPAPAGKVFSAYFSQLTRERRTVSAPPRSDAAAAPMELLSPDDVFLAVKSTGRFHRPRLELLLDTWISRNMQQTFVFTDTEDEELRKRMGSRLINTNCSAAHSRQALSCKMSQEINVFVTSGKKWFCHLDDDNYMNTGALRGLLGQYRHTQDVYVGRPSLERPIDAVEMRGTTETKQVKFWFATGGAGFCLSRGLALKMQPWASDFMATSEHIRLPDDCTVGYIVEALLGVQLIRSPLFHSHLENLGLVSDVHSQVTLSYGSVEESRNTVNLRGPFSLRDDPTRFRSIHCVLYPDTSWCPRPLHHHPTL